jgi:NAD(P)-dependent dehydrogenase (short-subunit alcohol dehydrogenase family)
MKHFKNKVAVITGASSGIGKAIARRCLDEGMRVVLAGINPDNLRATETELGAPSGMVLCFQTDVSKPDEVQRLAERTLDTFGGVHLLFNNAGVGAGSTVWDCTLADWQWVMGVNLWGVVHGIRAFMPLMLAQDTECHIVNTASVAGLLPYHPSAPYHVTKHAVVALSENLYFSLAQCNAKVKVSVLCPGWVKTRILESERNRPEEYLNPPQQQIFRPENEAIMQEMRQALEAGMSPDHLAGFVFEAIREDKFYILSHPEFTPAIQTRMEDILEQRNPS